MKALVTYLSVTGNTKKIAEIIHDEIRCEKKIYEMKELSSLDGYDVIFAGFPVWRFEPAGPALDFLNSHAAGKNIALFITHSSPYEADTDSRQRHFELTLNRCRKSVPGARLLGFFHCRGVLDASASMTLMKSDDPELKLLGERRNETLNHPDADELDVARLFTRDVINSL